MATGLLPSLALTIPVRDIGLVVILVSLLIAVLVWPVAIVSWRGGGQAGGDRILAGAGQAGGLVREIGPQLFARSDRTLV